MKKVTVLILAVVMMLLVSCGEPVDKYNQRVMESAKGQVGEQAKSDAVKQLNMQFVVIGYIKVPYFADNTNDDSGIWEAKTMVIQDVKTKVLYATIYGGNQCNLTPLFHADGTPITDAEELK